MTPRGGKHQSARRAHYVAITAAALIACGAQPGMMGVDVAVRGDSAASDAPEPDANTADAAPSDDASTDAVTADAGYPAGPYGIEIGSVVENLTFQGYWAPTQTTGLASSQPLGPITMDMLRTSGARFALIQLGAVW